jgi:GDP-4-dehydro-6-deoxy-D-mannose reductase
VPQAFLDRLRRDPHRIEVGDLSAVRDWVDVRDVARALVLLADPACATGCFNVCTGIGHSVEEILGRIVGLSGLSPEIRRNEVLSAHSPVSRSIGDCTRLRVATGWSPAATLDRSLRDMINFR